MYSVEHTADFKLSQPVEQVFPLFTPEGEKLWAPGWDYINILETTEISEDYVFLTAAHNHASTHAIWLVKRYLPERWRVEYYRVEPGDKVGAVSVKCEQNQDLSTRVEVTYKYTPLSEKGQVFVENFTAEQYAQFIAGWQTQLEAYFKLQAQ